MQTGGVNGLVIEHAQHMRLKGIALLAKIAFPRTLDIKTCYAGLRKASELLGIEIEMGGIEKEAKKFDEGFEEYLKEIQDKKRVKRKT